MSVQFAAIPIRALTDKRLDGPDFRLLGTIARYDRFGRNGTGCYVNARKLAQEARIHYKHLGRQTQRLEAFGYITIKASEADKRRKIYSVIYDEAEIVSCAGDNLVAVPSRADTAPPLDEKVTTSGGDRPEKATKPNSQAVDPQAKTESQHVTPRNQPTMLGKGIEGAATAEVEHVMMIFRRWQRIVGGRGG